MKQQLASADRNAKAKIQAMQCKLAEADELIMAAERRAGELVKAAERWAEEAIEAAERRAEEAEQQRMASAKASTGRETELTDQVDELEEEIRLLRLQYQTGPIEVRRMHVPYSFKARWRICTSGYSPEWPATLPPLCLQRFMPLNCCIRCRRGGGPGCPGRADGRGYAGCTGSWLRSVTHLADSWAGQLMCLTGTGA